MARRPVRPELTTEQQADAERLRRQLTDALAGDLDELAATLAATTDETIFGATEFAVRDLVLGIGAKAVQAAVADRAKKVATGAAARARPATGRPSSSDGSPAPSSPSSARSAGPARTTTAERAGPGTAPAIPPSACPPTGGRPGPRGWSPWSA